MMIRSLLFLLFLYTLLVWIVAVYLGGEFVQRGLFWTGVGVAALLLWLILERVIGWWRLSRARKPVGTAAAAAQPAAQKSAHPDDAGFRQVIDEANQRLAQSDATARTSSIFDLPLYLVLGTEGSGKTSVLQNSGMEPHLLAGQATSGTGVAVTTRIANIWLAKGSIYIELSGRIWGGDAARFNEFLQELRPKPVLRGPEAWFAGTKLGRMLQPQRQPTNLRGVLLVANLTDFNKPEISKLDRAASLVRERLDAISAHFGQNCPAYLLFSRADQIPYFKEFFARMSENEAGQVFGVMTPLDEAGSGSSDQVWAEAETRRLNRFFNHLFLRLSDRRLQALTTEPQLQLRPAIYEFPREFKRLRAPLVQYLVDIFRPNPLKEPPVLRGFFFTGTRMVERAASIRGNETVMFQAGSMQATQIFRGGATEIFTPEKLQHAAYAGQGGPLTPAWMFLTELFHKVLMQDRPRLVRVQTQSATPVTQYVLAACAAVVLTFVIIWSVSWFGNWGSVADTQELVEQMNRRPTSLSADNLRPVDELRQQLERLAANSSMSLHWGLYEGEDALQAGRKAYFRRIKTMFLDGTNATLAAGLTSAGAGSGESLYDRLKAHVTVSAKACPVDAALVNRVLEKTVGEWRPGLEPEPQSLIRKQLEYYTLLLAAEDMSPVALPQNDTAVAAARVTLRNSGGLDPQLNGILLQVAKQVPSLKFAERVPDYQRVLSGPAEVPGEFTKRGAVIVEGLIDSGNWGSSGEECVTGKGSNAVAGIVQNAESKNQLRDLYYLRYAEAWRGFLRGFKVNAYAGLQDAAVKLEILSGSQSPLLATVKVVAENTEFQARAGEVSRLVAVAQGIGFGSLVEKLKKGQKDAVQVQKAIEGPTGLTASDVTKLFQPVQVATPPGLPVLVSEANQAYVAGLRGLQQSVDTMARASEVDKPLIIPQAQSALQAAKAGLRTLADKFANIGNQGLNAELEDLLTQPIRNADRMLPINPVSLSSGQKNGELAAMCSAIRPVLGKYPFNSQVADAATLADIQRLLSPTAGAIWQYQKKSLAELVAKQGPLWAAVDPKAKVNDKLVNFLNASQQLTDVFFSGASGTLQPQLTYTIRPNSPPAVRLILDGQELNSARSGLQKVFQWPAAQGAVSGAQGFVGESIPIGQYDGMWGVFRLFQNADVRELGDVSVKWSRVRGLGSATPQLLPQTARIDFVKFPGGFDLFNPKFFEALQCPSPAILAR